MLRASPPPARALELLRSLNAAAIAVGTLHASGVAKAVKALKALSKGDIVEVKSMKKPPGGVKLTMEAVCILLGVKPGWDESKKLLGDMKFLERLKNYDKDNIKKKIIKKNTL